jgi:ABC-type ATPase with predicted acetyltransferase domain
MTTHYVYRKIEQGGPFSPKALKIMKMFGVTMDRLEKLNVKCSCKVNIEQGDIVYITGPSGSGKSVLLNMLREQMPADEIFNTSLVQFNPKQNAIDHLEGDFVMGLRWFCKVGLADLPAMVNFPQNLSEGQKWRLKLAAAISSNKKIIIADEFCSNLDRITAMTIAYNIRKFADQYKVTFILASSHRDLNPELMPEVIINRDLCGDTEVVYKKLQPHI